MDLVFLEMKNLSWTLGWIRFEKEFSLLFEL